jgi:hypothetical protein
MRRIALLALALVAAPACSAAPLPAPLQDRPISTIADQRLTVTRAAGSGDVVLFVSPDWTVPQPEVTRAVVLVHGLLGRDLYVRTAAELAAAGDASRTTVVLAPQFLSDLDARSHRLPDTVLRWRLGTPGAGGSATAPAAISSFEVIDAILARLADRSRFPRLARVVLAGHSGGGQMVQRYAVVGRGEPALTRAGIPLRYVVANPGSYLYFSEERPTPDGRFAPFDGARCASFDRWRYGLTGAPAYVTPMAPAELERAYTAREVIYLLGTDDNDPNHYELDKSCAGEAQGPDRHARGLAYMRYLQARHPTGLNHRVWEVPGVAHAGRAMFMSSCGLAALFDRPGCTRP